jgi:CheY-like chemotaxis protein
MDKTHARHGGRERSASALTAIDRFDLADGLAMSAQRAFGPARRKGLTLLHDYRGITPKVYGGWQRIERMTDHMLAWAIRSATRGSVSFEVVARRAGPGRCLVTLNVADVDVGIDAASAPGIGTNPAPADARSMSLLTLAGALCGAAGGHFYVRQLRHGGTLACAQFGLECLADGCDDEPCQEPASVDRVEAWLIGQPAHMLESLARRMRRHGWIPRLFETAREAGDELSSRGAERAPGCVLGAAPLGVAAEEIDALRRAMPDETVVGFLVDGARLPRPGPRGRAEVHPMPLAESVILHLAGRQKRQGGASTVGDPDPAERRTNVLVVDDDPTNRLVTTQVLQLLDCESGAAADGLAAVDHCLVHSPDAVLMDVSMPRMDGLTATRKLRQLQREGLIHRFPVIGATGEQDSRNERACIEAGMDAVLAKPLDRVALRRTLDRMLSVRRAT